MRAIQQYLPNPRHREINRIFVNAQPEEAWEKIRHFDAAAIPWIRLLFEIRTLPERIRGTRNPQPDHRIGIDQITENGNGFIILHETPGREVVVGSVGQFWHLTIPFATVQPEEFKKYNEPGWGKLAWAIVVEPYLNGSTISLELRTTATDDSSWRKLDKYYRIIGLGSRPIRNSLMKQYETILGRMKLPNRRNACLPGDEIIADAKYSYTQAKRIEAPRSIVWRYLMQLGCDRAGWYSIDLIDHSGIPSIDHLVEGWETRKEGDKLDATLSKDSFFNVYKVKTESNFVIGGQGHRFGGDFKMSWSFILEPVGEDATNLVTRVRLSAEPAWSGWLQGKLMAPVAHGLMQHVQLKTIKRFAERDAFAR